MTSRQSVWTQSQVKSSPIPLTEHTYGDPKVAMNVPFSVMKGRPDVARAVLLICNDGDKPMFFVLKKEADSTLKVRPVGKGIIQPDSAERIFLAWYLPKGTRHWEDVVQSKILLLTNFTDQSEENRDKELDTHTRLVGCVENNENNEREMIPTSELVFGSKESSILLTTHKTDTAAMPGDIFMPISHTAKSSHPSLHTNDEYGATFSKLQTKKEYEASIADGGDKDSFQNPSEQPGLISTRDQRLSERSKPSSTIPARSRKVFTERRPPYSARPRGIQQSDPLGTARVISSPLVRSKNGEVPSYSMHTPVTGRKERYGSAPVVTIREESPKDYELEAAQPELLMRKGHPLSSVSSISNERTQPITARYVGEPEESALTAFLIDFGSWLQTIRGDTILLLVIALVIGIVFRHFQQ